MSAFVFGCDCYLLCICFEDRLGKRRKETPVGFAGGPSKSKKLFKGKVEEVV